MSFNWPGVSKQAVGFMFMTYNETDNYSKGDVLNLGRFTNFLQMGSKNPNKHIYIQHIQVALILYSVSLLLVFYVILFTLVK